MNKIKVLIGDPNVLIPNIYQSYIEAIEGFTIVGIGNNRKVFLELLDQQEPDLIIFDDSLSDISSTEVTSLIRTKGLPIDFIMITAVNNGMAINLALRNGIFDYILKPYKIDRITDSLRLYRNFKEELTDKFALSQAELDHYNISRR